MPQVEVIDLSKDKDGKDIIIDDEDTEYTKSFSYRRNASYSFEYQFASTGDVKVKIELEQGNVLPDDEGEEDDNFSVPEDAVEFDNDVDDKVRHIKAYTPAPTRFLRAKLTGLEGNSAVTKLVKFNVCTIVNQ